MKLVAISKSYNIIISVIYNASSLVHVPPILSSGDVQVTIIPEKSQTDVLFQVVSPQIITSQLLLSIIIT